MDPKTRRVIRHNDRLLLSSVMLCVSQAGRARVLRDKAKNVHAYAIGELEELNNSGMELVQVSYDPYRFGYFFEKSSLRPRTEADIAYLDENGRLFLNK